MWQEKMKVEWDKKIELFSKSPIFANLSKQLGSYEGRLKDWVKQLDLKSQTARTKSRQRLNEFTVQLRKTSVQLEKRVNKIWIAEAKRLNIRLADLVVYLKSLATQENLAASRSMNPNGKRKTSSKKTTTKKKAKKKSPKTAPTLTAKASSPSAGTSAEL